MKIHLRQIPQGGSCTGELRGYEILRAGRSGGAPNFSFHYALEVGLSGGGLFATGRSACLFASDAWLV